MVRPVPADRQGAGCVNVLAESPPTLHGHDGVSGDLRRDRAAGDQARAGRRSGAVHGQHAPEGEREQRQVRCGEAGADAGRLHGGIERGSGCGPGRAWQEAADRDDDEPPSSKDTKLSRTDPDSGYMVRDDKPKGFFYLDHRTVDAKHAIITDTHVTPASVHDSQPYLDRLDRQRERFEFKVEAVGLDAGYFTPAVCQGLEERGIAGVMGYRTPNHKPGMFYKWQFKYDAYRNEYVCPQGQALPYSTTNRLGYREYKSNAQICGRCPVRSQCTNSAIAVKVVTRHVWERAKERVDARRLTEWGQRIYARRKQTVERSFADAKQLHGHRYARMRGLRKVAEQCLLAAAAQNIKKIAMLLARKRKKGPAGPDWRFVRMLLRLVSGLRCSFDYPLAANPQS
ncbi:IS1182 family transposase [Burkholderia mallei]|uniref:IS1182 family transposase n=1 Tax=Burkholderia mallei TaxID=13373 RepID=UPI002E0EE09D